MGWYAIREDEEESLYQGVEAGKMIPVKLSKQPRSSAFCRAWTVLITVCFIIAFSPQKNIRPVTVSSRHTFQPTRLISRRKSLLSNPHINPLSNLPMFLRMSLRTPLHMARP